MATVLTSPTSRSSKGSGAIAACFHQPNSCRVYSSRSSPSRGKASCASESATAVASLIASSSSPSLLDSSVDASSAPNRPTAPPPSASRRLRQKYLARSEWACSCDGSATPRRLTISSKAGTNDSGTTPSYQPAAAAAAVKTSRRERAVASERSRPISASRCRICSLIMSPTRSDASA
eukprot:scaffold2882_cov100-Isochrysis_galbana.AAC.7